MKLVVKQVDWNALRVQSESEFVQEYSDQFLKEGVSIPLDWDEYEKVVEEKGLFGKVKSRKLFMMQRTLMAYKVLENKGDSLILEVSGEAGGVWNDKKKKYLPQIVTLNVGESKEFKTDTFDAGKRYILTLEK